MLKFADDSTVNVTPRIVNIYIAPINIYFFMNWEYQEMVRDNNFYIPVVMSRSKNEFMFIWFIYNYFISFENSCKSNTTGTFFFLLGFTPCKTEQPLQSMVLQEKEAQQY